MHIKITKGLDIPMKGLPQGAVKTLIPSGHGEAVNPPAQIALNLRSFPEVKFRLLVKVGDTVKIGQPLAEDKDVPGRMFASPASGVILEIRRGLKRILQEIVIGVATKEEYQEYPPLDILEKTIPKADIIERLLKGGSFAAIRARPFDTLANPEVLPRNIFVKALESAPCVPPAELQVQGHEREFQAGLNALATLTNGKVHLVYRHDTPSKAFKEAKNVVHHTAEGPHPVANSSLHIERIDPIQNGDDIVWTINALDVVGIGNLLLNGRYYIKRVVSIAGPGVIEGARGYFALRSGFPISSLLTGRIENGEMRLVSGDPLMGKKVAVEDFLGFSHTAFTVIPENTEREFLHFMGLGLNKYSFSKAYMSGHLDNKTREYDFTTNQHGEHRPFIDSTLYDKLQPLHVPTMLLVKAVMAEDFDLADTLGLCEVASEDFALPTFVCPSKMEMTEIIEAGLKQYAKERL